jgi:4-amino-4-deoxy-L-arabinose transferase-like glycosyltransferase
LSNLVARTTQILTDKGDDDQRDAILIGLLLMALAVRLVLALALPITFRYGTQDTLEYVSVARHLLTQGLFGQEPGVPYASIPPLYPLFIAGVFALTNQSLMAVRIMQVILGTGIVWLTYLLGRESATKHSVLLGALISAFYPAWLIYNLVLMTETLFTAVFLVLVWFLIRSLKTNAKWDIVLAGVTFALTLLTREMLLALPLFLPIAFWWARISWAQAGRYILLFTLATLLVISPWLARNYVTFDHVFFTERLEKVRYQLTGTGYLSPRYEYLADEDEPAPLQAEKDQRFGKPRDMLSVRLLVTEPKTYLRYLANRLIEQWLHPHGLQSLPDVFLIRGLYVAAHAALLLLAGVGTFIGLRRRDIAVGIWLLILVCATGTFVFFKMPRPRYLMPFLPLVFILAAIGTEAIVRYVQRKGAPSGAGGGVAPYVPG